jgi:ubiquinone/menaquinone biosynthesis C-methylase UbiE
MIRRPGGVNRVGSQTISELRRRDRFARWAPQYENGEVMSRLLSGLQVGAAAMLRLATGDRFLDVGCATGAAVRAAAPTVDVALGIDSSAAMIQQARVLAATLPRAAFVVADAQQLPFPPGTFSAILCSTALRHFTDPAAAQREMIRVLTPAGRIVVADFLERGDKRDRPWWRGLQCPSPMRWWDGPLQAASTSEMIVTEVIRCGTALGPYLFVAAAKPEIRAC